MTAAVEPPAPDRKPTIPEVVARFADYRRKPGNGAWGSLHIVLDDGNVGDPHVEFCRETALAAGDGDAVPLVDLLLRMSRTQRLKLDGAVRLHLAADDGPADARDHGGGPR